MRAKQPHEQKPSDKEGAATHNVEVTTNRKVSVLGVSIGYSEPISLAPMCRN